LRDTYDAQTYSKRREQARQVAEAKAEETIAKRVLKVIEVLRG
jgi:chorismate mutase